MTENNEVKIGQTYHDVGGERRGRTIGRYVEVVGIVTGAGITDPIVLVKNTKADKRGNRPTIKIKASRLLKKSRFSLIVTPEPAFPATAP